MLSSRRAWRRVADQTFLEGEDVACVASIGDLALGVSDCVCVLCNEESCVCVLCMYCKM